MALVLVAMASAAPVQGAAALDAKAKKVDERLHAIARKIKALKVHEKQTPQMSAGTMAVLVVSCPMIQTCVITPPVMQARLPRREVESLQEQQSRDVVLWNKCQQKANN